MQHRQDPPRGLGLEGKIVLVTGASRGVGAAIVRAARAQGAEVVLHYGRSREQAEALAWRGRIDVLVNNAAVYEAVALDADEAVWDAAMARTLQVNLLAPATLTRAAFAHFASGSRGATIDIESRAAFRGEGAVYAPYAASKGALVSFGRTVARGCASGARRTGSGRVRETGGRKRRLDPASKPAKGTERIACIAPVPTHAVNAMVRRSKSLQATKDSEFRGVGLSPDKVEGLGLADGEPTVVRQNREPVTLGIVMDSGGPRVPAGQGSGHYGARYR